MSLFKINEKNKIVSVFDNKTFSKSLKRLLLSVPSWKICAGINKCNATLSASDSGNIDIKKNKNKKINMYLSNKIFL